MGKSLLFRFLAIIFISSFFLYLYTDQHNKLTQLRFRVPTLTKEIRLILEENKRLRYQVDRFESPQNLIQLARQSEFSHLKQPLTKEIFRCREGVALKCEPPTKKELAPVRLKPTLAVAP